MARCTSCGAELPDYYTSCPNCGGQQVVRGAAPAPQPQNYVPMQEDRVVCTTGQWFGWLLLLAFVPLIGIIVMLCTVKDPSAKNYAKLMLILMIIATVFYAIIFAVTMIPAVMESAFVSSMMGMILS